MHFVDAKGILTGNSDYYRMNIYRGCSHGCIYCDSRSKCYQFTHPFEDIEVKRNAPELLEIALRSKRKRCMIGTGAMSDPYMHCEEELRLTRKCLEIIRKYGFGAAIQTKSDRILQDIDLLDVAVSVQTNVGGNMIEILENISSTLTAKHDLEEDIKVKTASGKITGIMLAVLPILILIVLNIMNPDYISIFFEEQIGQYMLIFCAFWELIGFLIIRKILSVKF